jgi:hypothetical protein
MMASLFALFIIVLPLILATLLVVFSNHWNTRRTILSSCSVLLLAMLWTVIAFFAPTPFQYCFSWQPAAGEMCIVFDKPSLVLVFLMNISLLFLFVIARNETGPHSARQFALALASLSVANVAFLTEHFLLRYVALELVGLCVVVGAWLLSSPRENTWQTVKTVFFNFRIGDVSLLIAIFLMVSLSNTFHIDQNFTIAALADPPVRSVLNFALMLAVCVKMAIFPLDRWADVYATFSPLLRTWFTTLLLPALGAYLLYRISPLLLSNPTDALWMLTAIGIFFFLRKIILPHNTQNAAFERELLMFFSLCLLLLAAFTEQKLLWGLLILWLTIRTIFVLFTIERRSHAPPPQFQKSMLGFLAYFLIVGFSIIAFWWAFLSVNSIPAILLIAYMLLLMTQFLRLQKLIFDQEHEAGFGLKRGNIKRVLIANVLNSLVAMLVIAILIISLFYFSGLVKGENLWVVPIPLTFENVPFFSVSLCVAFAVSGLLVLVLHTTGNLRGRIKLVASSHFSTKEMSSKLDPQHFGEVLSATLTKAVQYVYDQVEYNLLDKFVATIGKISKFLFTTVEKYSSADLWHKCLSSIMRSSRHLQRLHPGLLRFNLFWLFFCIVFLIVMALVLYNGTFQLAG